MEGIEDIYGNKTRTCVYCIPYSIKNKITNISYFMSCL